MFPATLWNIWKNRNRVSIIGERRLTYKIVSDIRSLALDTEYAFNQQSGRPSMDRFVSWKAPPPNLFALNTDDNSYGNPGRVGYGGLIRDSNGNWRMGFYVA
ncbi:putative ribonuclease H protein [Sesbania bispinosa]|nr:putative ribonuclease H protein [Sesbania bispinosa]